MRKSYSNNQNCYIQVPYGGFQKWGYPQIIHFSDMLPYKPTILGKLPYIHGSPPNHRLLGAHLLGLTNPKVGTWMQHIQCNQGDLRKVTSVNEKPEKYHHAPLPLLLHCTTYKCICKMTWLHTVVHINVHIYVCIYIYVCMYLCLYVCMYVCMSVCLYVCLYVCMYLCMYVCVLNIFIYIYIHVFVHMCIYVNTTGYHII